ncbi:5'/3'-nucleotidase SurE [Helicobacter trogontum]|uniref:5'-nucleotidase SurE n=1 Tax=Helicobacter trogontum TaxID=50960 RepID=A0A4U8SDW0_9HELI|nr:5'/3'-nucleotidase SurE [Helicobacter trogontum]TLD84326.1 5'/3'-nucleotidase SurE [Helicobacter trogontum]
MNKTIFLTNDDGYFSQGLIALRNTLSDIARVVVVAPAHEKSACGHSLCVSKPLQLIELERDFYKLDDGSPTDCVYVGLCELFSTEKPDLLISGINIGANLGEDTTYSGTVAGAIEGALHGIQSIAISQFIDDKHGEDNKLVNRDFTLALDTIKQLASDILHNRYLIGHRKLLNINIPAIPKDKCKGIQATQLGYRIYNSKAQDMQSPRGQKYHWIGLNPIQWQERNNIDNPYIKNNHYIYQDMQMPVVNDFEAVMNNYVSITPMQLDMTDYVCMQTLHSYCAKR